VQCLSCNKTIQQGEVLAELSHTAGDRVDVSAAECEKTGYTGDVFCTVCGKMLQQGEIIPVVGHIPSDERVNAAEATCGDMGYTGDICCTVCDKVLEEGIAIAKLAHPDDQLVMYENTVINATCTQTGYSGDVYCGVCGGLVEEGHELPILEHTYGERVNAMEATCQHEGYKGDRACKVCNNVEIGTVTERLPHSFTENTCTMCGWRFPGLYDGDMLVYTWQELVDGGYVTVDGDSLIDVVDTLPGTLVISDDILHIVGHSPFFGRVSPFQGMTEIESIYIPSTISEIGDKFYYIGVFGDCAKLREVRMFSTILDIVSTSNAFRNCVSLTTFTVPEGAVSIGESAFSGCTSLSEINLPASLQTIGKFAFAKTALTHFEPQEGLLEIGWGAFQETQVKEIILPSTITYAGGSSSFEHIDARACKWEAVQDYQFSSSSGGYNGTSALKEILLPNTITSIGDSAFTGNTELERLVLPEGVNDFITYSSWYETFKSCNSLKTVVWPVSLIDGEVFTSCPALEKILYRGTEFQWKLTTSTSLFENIEIEYEYSGD
jgi:hypothetical protein